MVMPGRKPMLVVSAPEVQMEMPAPTSELVALDAPAGKARKVSFIFTSEVVRSRQPFER
jgi:hypothetical protein